MRRIAAILACIALAACDAAGGPTNDGPLALGIVSGQDQVAVAGAEKLGQPVVGKLVRTPSGGITFRLVTPAYAQGTVVSGSPVPGAVVCAVSVTEGGMVPFTPCTNTGQDGTATFFFSPGTKAGEARSEIRGTVEGQPAVFDTARATVEPGPVGHFLYGMGITIPIYGALADSAVTDAYWNPVAYRVEADAPFKVSPTDPHLIVVADSAAWDALGYGEPRSAVRVLAGDSVVATGEAIRDDEIITVEWQSAIVPSGPRH